jgi:hypothetical protein
MLRTLISFCATSAAALQPLPYVYHYPANGEYVLEEWCEINSPRFVA